VIYYASAFAVVGGRQHSRVGKREKGGKEGKRKGGPRGLETVTLQTENAEPKREREKKGEGKDRMPTISPAMLTG